MGLAWLIGGQTGMQWLLPGCRTAGEGGASRSFSFSTPGARAVKKVLWQYAKVKESIRKSPLVCSALVSKV